MTQLNSLFHSFRRQHDGDSPATNIAVVKPVHSAREEKESYQLIVHLPGVAKNGLEVQAEQNELKIVGRRTWTPPSSWSVLHRETSQADFSLSLDHAGNIDAEKISAELKDGVLRISLSKVEAIKPRRIAIQ